MICYDFEGYNQQDVILVPFFVQPELECMFYIKFLELYIESILRRDMKRTDPSLNALFFGMPITCS